MTKPRPIGDPVSRIMHMRIAQFLMVGSICVVVQYAIYYALYFGFSPGKGIIETLFFAVAFAASAQVNFFLNYTVTWGDRRKPPTFSEMLKSRWAPFQFLATTLLLGNTFIFSLALHFYESWQMSLNRHNVSSLAALVTATGVNLFFSLSLNHFVVFRHYQEQHSPLPEFETAAISKP